MAAARTRGARTDGQTTRRRILLALGAGPPEDGLTPGMITQLAARGFHHAGAGHTLGDAGMPGTWGDHKPTMRPAAGAGRAEGSYEGVLSALRAMLREGLVVERDDGRWALA